MSYPQTSTTETKGAYIVNTPDVNAVYANTPVNRYVVTSRIPVITQEEILSSTYVYGLITDVFREILIDNDKQLITNILDQSKKVILTQEQLVRILVGILSINSSGAAVTSNDIRIKYSEDIISSCLKTSVSPFKNIISIKVFEQELGQVQSEVVSVLSTVFKISLETFYQPLKINTA